VQVLESVRVLGVWVDPRLAWKSQVDRALDKGENTFTALSRIAASTWGPSAERSRLLYTSTIRPTTLYAASTWAAGGRPEGLASSLRAPTFYLY
jgi:hypothetical protein